MARPVASEPAFSETLELDLGTVVPSLAGPTRPQDRVPLDGPPGDVRRRARGHPARTSPPSGSQRHAGRGVGRVVPGKRPAGRGRGDSGVGLPTRCPTGTQRTGDRPSRPVPVTLDDGTSFELDHGHVVIAAITSCTNTSNPSVMLAAGAPGQERGRAGARRQAMGEDARSRPGPGWSWTTTSAPGCCPTSRSWASTWSGSAARRASATPARSSPRSRPRSTGAGCRCVRCCPATATSRAASTPTCA